MKNIVILAFMILYSIGMNAQKKTITGIVTDETKEPLAGVVIRVKSSSVNEEELIINCSGTPQIKAEELEKVVTSDIVEALKGEITEEKIGKTKDSLSVANTVMSEKNNAIVTNFDGSFKIAVNEDEVLVFSSLGYVIKEVKIEGETILNVEMKADSAKLDEIVVCGYGVKKRTIVTNCSNLIQVKKVIEKNKQEHPFKIYKIRNENFVTQQDVYNAIRAEVPNVQITNTQAQETPTITMRGDDNTIVIIDGIRTTIDALHSLNPSSIETIEVSNNTAATNYLLTPRN